LTAVVCAHSLALTAGRARSAPEEAANLDFHACQLR
jgi:hypothetical protein